MTNPNISIIVNFRNINSNAKEFEMSNPKHDPLEKHSHLKPIPGKVASDDPDGRHDSWEDFKREVNRRYPGTDTSGIDEEAVRRLIDEIRKGLKRSR